MNKVQKAFLLSLPKNATVSDSFCEMFVHEALKDNTRGVVYTFVPKIEKYVLSLRTGRDTEVIASYTNLDEAQAAKEFAEKQNVDKLDNFVYYTITTVLVNT